MRLNETLSKHFPLVDDGDPRDLIGAEVIDLQTRTVLPAVSQRKVGSDRLGLLAAVVIVGSLGAFTLWRMDHARIATQQVKQPSPVATPVPAPPSNSSRLRPLGNAIAPAAIPARPPSEVVLMGPRPSTAAQPTQNLQPSQIVVFDASALPIQGPVGAPGGIGSSADNLGTQISAASGGPATATAMIDPKTTVTQGTLIPAILETSINTDVPGFTRAIVSTDVRSFDGSRVLIPRSSRLIGEYKSSLQAGQKRAYVIWTRVIRPDGVSVNIASPAIAFSGEAGLGGKVDNHFLARFGSAMLLSVIGGLSSLGSGGATAIVTGGSQSAAATAVGQTGQIGPTIRVHQGEPIRVFTARDLDFSKVETQ